MPSDYHARMLICSMYDNILSVKAPFIMDLFSFAVSDVEKYSSRIFHITDNGLDESIIVELKNKYFKRMTYDSIKKSYKTFVRLLFVSEDDNCKKNLFGLYAFTYALTDHITRSGYLQFFNEPDIHLSLAKISIDMLKESDSRRHALTSIMVNFPIVMDCIRSNFYPLFDYISNYVLLTPRGLEMYKVFHPRSNKTIYSFFIENDKLKQAYYTETLYKVLKDCDNFNINEFMKEIVSHIPSYSAYRDADAFMSSFISHLAEMTIEGVEEVIGIYKRNNQCTNRSRHSTDIAEVNKYLEECKAKSET